MNHDTEFIPFARPSIGMDEEQALLEVLRSGWLIGEEGLLVGGSSGSVVWGMLEALETMPEARRALCILPDSIRNYLTKFVDDEWLRALGLLDAVRQ